ERSALCRRVRTLGLEEVIQLPGPVENVIQLLAAADLMVHPSIEEGFGLAILEGMSQECAVVATNVGGIPEVMEDGVTGILVPPGSPQRMAAAITELLTDADRRQRMGVAGRGGPGGYVGDGLMRDGICVH